MFLAKYSTNQLASDEEDDSFFSEGFQSITQDIFEGVSKIENALFGRREDVFDDFLKAIVPPASPLAPKNECPIPEEYSKFQRNLANTPLLKFRNTWMEAKTLEQEGRRDEAKGLKMELLGLARVYDVISQPHETLFCQILIASAHFRLAESYLDDRLIKQAINHAKECVKIIDGVHGAELEMGDPYPETCIMRRRMHLLLSAVLIENNPPNPQEALDHLEIALDYNVADGSQAIGCVSKLRIGSTYNLLGVQVLHRAVQLRLDRKETERTVTTLEMKFFGADAYEQSKLKAKLACVKEDVAHRIGSEESALKTAIEYLDKAVDQVMDVITTIEARIKLMEDSELADERQVVFRKLYGFCSSVMFFLAQAHSFIGDKDRAISLLGEIISVNNAYGCISTGVLIEVYQRRAAMLLKANRLDESLLATDALLDLVQYEFQSSKGALHGPRRGHRSKGPRQVLINARKMKGDILMGVCKPDLAVDQYKLAVILLEEAGRHSDPTTQELKERIRAADMISEPLELV